MAFEAFLTQRTAARPRRRLTYALSLAVHGAVLAGGVAYSFWRVEELSPPTVKVTFMSAPALPAPPPPPPPAGGGDTRKKSPTVKPRPSQALVQPRLVQPKKEEPEPKPPDENDDDDDRGFAGGQKAGQQGGTAGGTIGGKVGGKLGGTVGGAGDGPAAPLAPKLLAPRLGALQKLDGADPDFPAVLRRAGRSYLVTAKICVSRAGAVDGVTIIQGADPLLDRNVIAAVKAWRYRPLLANDTAVPFCYSGRFEFKSD